MIRRLALIAFLLSFPHGAFAADLATAPSDQLLQEYKQLRSLQGSQQGAVAENVVIKRDAATFTLQDGKLTLAEPVAGRVLAAVFVGRGKFELDPPDAVDQKQISRYSGAATLVDSFRQVVFFFTDDSLGQIQSQVKMQSNANSDDATKAISGAEGNYQQNFNDWWSNERKGNPQMRNLAARMLSDLTDPTSRGFFLADFKGDHSGDLLFQVSWNRPPLLLPEFSSGDEVTLLHINRNNYYEWWAGFHLANEYARSSHPDHRTLLAHCNQETVDLNVSKDNHISATAEMEFQVNEGTPRVLPLNLQGVLRISDVADGEGKKFAFIQEARELDNDPWIIMPEPAKAGTPYKMKITYQEDSTRDSRIILQQGSGLYYVGARESWFPSFGAFDDRTNFVMNVQSPKKYQMVATGELQKSQKEKNALETEWRTDIPLGVIGFNYGDFVDKKQSDRQLTVTAFGGKEVPDELKNVETSLAMAELAGGPGDWGYGVSHRNLGRRIQHCVECPVRSERKLSGA